jgi:D-cysteine desulfhydrase
VAKTDPLARRLRLLDLPTPVQRLDRLAARLGKPPGAVWVKRDDLTAIAGGGNKSRKLEYALVDAVEAGADHVLTLGGAQSNAARAVAGAAAVLGMRATILAVGRPPERISGNLLLDELLGAEIVWIDPDDERSSDQALADEARRLTGQGRRAFVIPVGVSTPVGALGYVSAARELTDQVPGLDVVVTATGSAGTQAGLAAGLGDHRRVLGVRIGTRRALRERIATLAQQTAEFAGLDAPVGDVRLDERHLGDGYGAHTNDAAAAIRLLARTEGLLLDPVYTGKAMAALLTCCREGSIGTGQVVVFLHSGGLPGLFADEHAAWLAG